MKRDVGFQLEVEIMDSFAVVSQCLQHRISVRPKYLQLPKPSEEVLQAAIQSAYAAPFHGQQEKPFRFVEITSRQKLETLFLSALPEDADEFQKQKAKDKAYKGSVVLALIWQQPTAQASERWTQESLMTAGGALTNVLNVLYAAGYGAFTLSAKDFKDPMGLYDPQTERILAFILIGSVETLPTRTLEPVTYSAW